MVRLRFFLGWILSISFTVFYLSTPIMALSGKPIFSEPIIVEVDRFNVPAGFSNEKTESLKSFLRSYLGNTGITLYDATVDKAIGKEQFDISDGDVITRDIVVDYKIFADISYVDSSDMRMDVEIADFRKRGLIQKTVYAVAHKDDLQTLAGLVAQRIAESLSKKVAGTGVRVVTYPVIDCDLDVIPKDKSKTSLHFKTPATVELELGAYTVVVKHQDCNEKRRDVAIADRVLSYHEDLSFKMVCGEERFQGKKKGKGTKTLLAILAIGAAAYFIANQGGDDTPSESSSSNDSSTGHGTITW